MASVKEVMSESAIKTLVQLGFTYNGGEYWKPPIGKRPNFELLQYWQERAEAAEYYLEKLTTPRRDKRDGHCNHSL